MGTRRPDRPFGVELKAAFVEAARRIVVEHGPGALSVRAVAAAANASPTAPYAFFPGRGTELLAAVATTGFVDLIDALGDDQGRNGGVRIVDLVRRYARFGVENPNLYRAMFHELLAPALSSFEIGALEPVPGFATYQELYGLKMHAFEIIKAPLEAMAAAGSLLADSAEDGALAVAALAHGLVGEFIDEGLLLRDSLDRAWSPSRERMTKRVTDIMVKGLAR